MVRQYRFHSAEELYYFTSISKLSIQLIDILKYNLITHESSYLHAFFYVYSQWIYLSNL